ncbi:MAG TPA: BTAD domain-containing putative transcriptional regulator [Acidimicrobiales bacterium]|nr:BTAD domain-containing putative transcriptional regulator [Acidimicrobiales bacterium]
MPSSFRFGPPSPRPDLLTRPRLLRALLTRWERRVVALVGGPGLGKTTVLGQAVAENLLAPRGEDVWIGVESRDAESDGLGRAVARAVGVGAEPGPDPFGVADLLWQRSPTAVCLILDDVHLLPPGSHGARWLARLVDHLPANAHVVLAGRTRPPLPLARLRTQGAALVVGEGDLRFSDEELVEFGARRGVDPERFHDTGGWPAMAELTASVERHLAGAYVWEEVLEPLGAERRHILAAVCDLGGADDGLASAALGTPVDLDRALDGVPLVAAGEDGWRVPHGLWRAMGGIGLDDADRAAVRRRAVEHLVERGRYDDAYGLVADAGLWQLAPAVLRAACVASDRPTSGQLRRWLSVSPDEVRTSPAGCLAAGMHAAFTTPRDAVGPLQVAVERCRAESDVDTELGALAELGRVAWWSQDLAVIVPVAVRVNELAETGHPLARGLAAFGRAVAADLAGDDDGVLAALDGIEPGVLDAGWTASARWLRARILLSSGRPAVALDVLDHIDAGADPVMRAIVENLRVGALSGMGRVDEALALLPRATELQSAAGVAHNRRLAVMSAVAGFAHVGDVATARRYGRDLDTAGAGWADGFGVPGALAAATLLVAEDDEEQAGAVIRGAIRDHGLDRGAMRRAWRGSLPLSYVLVPETREHWDAVAPTGGLVVPRRLCAGVVAARSGRLDQLRALELPDLQIVRATLHHRFAADLAVGLAAADRPEGPALLEILGGPGRDVVRALAGSNRDLARQARSLLAAVPGPPPGLSYLAVLGPLELRRDGPGGPEVADPDLRRERVRTLLAFLVGHRVTTRAEVAAALWPDLDERSAANNLRVTLNYLLRVLEPWRPAGEPGYFVRLDGPRVELVTGGELLVDADAFDRHVEAAARAEADGTPSVALEHHLGAVALYRGPLHADAPDADWIDLDREHYRTRFVRAAVRAAQLLLGRGDLDRAERTARHALAVDRWAEEGYAVLTAAALARGDRSAAHRHLDRGLAALAELGVEPSEATHQLRRRIRA